MFLWLTRSRRSIRPSFIIWPWPSFIIYSPLHSICDLIWFVLNKTNYEQVHVYKVQQCLWRSGIMWKQSNSSNTMYKKQNMWGFIWETSFTVKTPSQFLNHEPINHDQLKLRKRRARGKNSMYIIASPTHYLQHAVPRERSCSKAYEGWDWSSLDYNKASIITYSYSFTEESRSEPPWNTICLRSFALPPRPPPPPHRSLVSLFIKRDQ